MIQTMKKSALFNTMTDDEIQSVLLCLDFKEKTYLKDEMILNVGGKTEDIGFILKGNVHVISDDFWGNRNLLSSLGEGEVFAESFACAPGSKLTVSVMAETNVTVLWLKVKKILTTCQSTCVHHYKLIRNLVSEISEKNLAYNDKITHISQRTTRDKILSYLSSVAEKNDSSDFYIPYNRQQMADFLSVDRSALSKELSRLKDEEILEYNKNYFILKKSFE